MDSHWKVQLQSEDPAERGKAIRSLALSEQREHLETLRHIHEHDPDPRLRTFAKKAAGHLYQSLNSRTGEGALQGEGKETSGPASAPAQEAPSAPAEAERVSKERDSPPDRPADRGEAADQAGRGSLAGGDLLREEISVSERRVQRAFSLYTAGQTDQALKVLGRALEDEPDLENDPFTRNLAAEITGKPAEEALRSLLDRNRRRELLEATKGQAKKSSPAVRPLSLILLVLALLALAGVSYRFVRTGTLDRYRALLARQMGGFNQRRAGGKSYYLLKPLGSPPEAGWPVVVGLHGYGGRGADMLPIADQFTSAGAAYIAPTFGEYQPNPGIGPVDPMRLILEDVSSRIPVDRNRVVLLGFSQGGTFAYRFSVFHPEWVSGVVTAGAPDLGAGSPTQADLPYIFTWGSEDGLQDLVLPTHVYPLMDQGYNIRYQIIPGAGHQITPYALNQALILAGMR